MSVVAVCDQPQVSVERLCSFVVHWVEEVHPVLVCFVREVGKKALVNKVVQLLLGYLKILIKGKRLYYQGPHIQR